MHETLLADIATELPPAVRLQRLVCTLREHFGCGAVAVLQREDDSLRPVAVDGLVHEALGRRFVVSQHPRLAAILARRGVTRFEPDSELPDPYDGLLDAQPGESLAVHDCMGVSLYVEGVQWGVLTLDALQAHAFDEAARDALRRYALLAEAAVRVTRLENEMRGLRLSRAEPEQAVGGLVAAGSEIVGNSEAIAELLREIDVVADSGLPVLLLGETGVGKELFARRIHQRSRRRDRPLVHVNCAALPESLAESELFGHVKGAFSGASVERPGRFEAADGGTLLLDEVGELPLPVQAKLLRALQNGEIQRLGEDRPRSVDVRVVAATNRNLREAVRDGRFRADLYHRLSVYPVPIPPLRERGGDVLLLDGRFLELNRARLGVRSLRLSPEAEIALMRYRWPGNVRELEHVISRAALKALSRGAARSDIVTLDAGLLDLEPGDGGLSDGAGVGPAGGVAGADRLFDGGLPAGEGLPPGGTGRGLSHGAAALPPLRQAVEALQRQLVRQALALSGGNWSQAAHCLDVDPSNLHKLAQRLGLKAARRRGVRG